MNSLSWIIYVAGLVNPLGGFLAFFAVISGIFFVITMITATVFRFDDSDSSYRKYSNNELLNSAELSKKFRNWSFFSIIMMFVFGVSSAAIPNRETVLLIAASEIGERVITNQNVSEIVGNSAQLLNTWIQDQRAQIERAASQRNR